MDLRRDDFYQVEKPRDQDPEMGRLKDCFAHSRIKNAAICKIGQGTVDLKKVTSRFDKYIDTIQILT